jgi:type IV pilus assembly protein PilV
MCFLPLAQYLKLQRIKRLSSSQRGQKVDKKGFTLIEVLVGLILLSIGLLAIAGLQITSVKGNFFSHYLTQASYAGQDRLEALDNRPYSSNELSAGTHNDPAATIAGIVFNRSYTVVDDPNGYKIINYTISWNDGANRSITLSTIRSQ